MAEILLLEQVLQLESLYSRTNLTPRFILRFFEKIKMFGLK